MMTSLKLCQLVSILMVAMQKVLPQRLYLKAIPTGSLSSTFFFLLQTEKKGLLEFMLLVYIFQVTPNLYGNLVANTAAGIAGGTGVMPGGILTNFKFLFLLPLIFLLL